MKASSLILLLFILSGAPSAFAQEGMDQEMIAPAADQTDGGSMKVNAACYGTCEGQGFSRAFYENPQKAASDYNEIMQIRATETDEQLQKTKAEKEKPFGI